MTQTQQLFALQHKTLFTFLCNKYGVPYLYSDKRSAEHSAYRNFQKDWKDFEVVEIVIQRRIP